MRRQRALRKNLGRAAALLAATALVVVPAGQSMAADTEPVEAADAYAVGYGYATDYYVGYDAAGQAQEADDEDAAAYVDDYYVGYAATEVAAEVVPTAEPTVAVEPAPTEGLAIVPLSEPVATGTICGFGGPAGAPGGAPWALYADGTMTVGGGTFPNFRQHPTRPGDPPRCNPAQLPWRFTHSTDEGDIDVVNLIFTDANLELPAYMNLFFARPWAGAPLLQSITGLELLDTTNVVYMAVMFQGQSALTSLNIGGWNVENVTTMGGMFQDNMSLTHLDLAEWDTGRVYEMGGMFGSVRMTELDSIQNWDTSSVAYFDRMFWDARNIVSLDLSAWNTANGRRMDRMFEWTTNLENLNVSTWNVQNLRFQEHMFQGATSLRTLDLSGWNPSSIRSFDRTGIPAVNNSQGMFNQVPLEELILGATFQTAGANNGLWDLVPGDPCSADAFTGNWVNTADAALPTETSAELRGLMADNDSEGTWIWERYAAFNTTLTTVPATGGTATISHASRVPACDVDVTAEAAEGYRLVSVTLNGDELPVVDGETSFVKPSMASNVIVTFVPEESQGSHPGDTGGSDTGGSDTGGGTGSGTGGGETGGGTGTGATAQPSRPNLPVTGASIAAAVAGAAALVGAGLALVRRSRDKA
jgi:surface protein